VVESKSPMKIQRACLRSHWTAHCGAKIAQHTVGRISAAHPPMPWCVLRRMRCAYPPYKTTLPTC